MLSAECTEFPTLSVTAITKDLLGDLIYDDVIKTMSASSAAQMYLPLEANGDWILEIWMGLTAGQTILEARDSSLDDLKEVFGIYLFVAVIISKLIKE